MKPTTRFTMAIFFLMAIIFFFMDLAFMELQEIDRQDQLLEAYSSGQPSADADPARQDGTYLDKDGNVIRQGDDDAGQEKTGMAGEVSPPKAQTRWGPISAIFRPLTGTFLMVAFAGGIALGSAFTERTIIKQ